MFDTMTMTKIMGGFCGTFLVFLLGGWAAETIYHSGSGHGDHASGYVIEVENADTGPVETGPTFAEVYATADAAAGERVFRKCSGCHKLDDGGIGAGPHLWDIVDRDVAGVDGFAYSGALVAVAQVWDVEALNAFLESPRSYAPGTAMSFNGLSKIEDRANLIAYLQTFGG